MRRSYRIDGDLADLLSEAGLRCPAVWRWNEPACVEAVAELMDAVGRPLTHSEIGALLGLTRQRAQQIEARALARLQRWRAGAELAVDLGRDGGSWDAWGAQYEAAAGDTW